METTDTVRMKNRKTGEECIVDPKDVERWKARGCDVVGEIAAAPNPEPVSAFEAAVASGEESVDAAPAPSDRPKTKQKAEFFHSPGLQQA